MAQQSLHGRLPVQVVRRAAYEVGSSGGPVVRYEEDPLRYMSAIIEGWGDLSKVVTAVPHLKARFGHRDERRDGAAAVAAAVAALPATPASASA